MVRKSSIVLILVAAMLLVALPVSAQQYQSYIVQPGDSLAKIALKYCTDWTEIYNINRQTIGEDPNNIEIGMLLTVSNRCGATHLPSQPGQQPVPPASGIFDRGARAHATGTIVNSNIYSVAWGDTLFSIGLRFGPSVDQLRAANGLNEDSILFATARIVIPGLNGVFVSQLPLTPGVNAPIVGTVPSQERAFQVDECRVTVISSYPASNSPNGPVVATLEPATYGAARISVINGRDWFQVEYIDTLIWIGDTVERMNLGRTGNCSA
ncbi:MAG: LysM peptidoglycan-binding domain-containing protein [Anaerolineae bacterium]|nr:LysM peptidoglycan-binding domain-containing protein [Anaerolineae bacterium]